MFGQLNPTSPVNVYTLPAIKQFTRPQILLSILRYQMGLQILFHGLPKYDLTTTNLYNEEGVRVLNLEQDVHLLSLCPLPKHVLPPFTNTLRSGFAQSQTF
jgi:hypothetical protein